MDTENDELKRSYKRILNLLEKADAVIDSVTRPVVDSDIKLDVYLPGLGVDLYFPGREPEELQRAKVFTFRCRQLTPSANIDIIKKTQEILEILLKREDVLNYLTTFYNTFGPYLRRGIPTDDELEQLRAALLLSAPSLSEIKPNKTNNNFLDYFIETQQEICSVIPKIYLRTPKGIFYTLEENKKLFLFERKIIDLLRSLAFANLSAYLLAATELKGTKHTFKKVNLTKNGIICIQKAFPFFLEGRMRRNDIKPMHINLNFKKYDGAFLIGPNNAGKSVFLTTLISSLFYASTLGYCPVEKGDVGIGWIPKHIITLKPIERRASGGSGAFERQLSEIFEELHYHDYEDHKWGKRVKTDALLILDDVGLEGLTDEESLFYLYNNVFRKLAKERRVYTIATMRHPYLMEKLDSFQKIFITKEHEVKYVKPKKIDNEGILIIKKVFEKFGY